MTLLSEVTASQNIQLFDAVFMTSQHLHSLSIVVIVIVIAIVIVIVIVIVILLLLLLLWNDCFPKNLIVWRSFHLILTGL